MGRYFYKKHNFILFLTIIFVICFGHAISALPSRPASGNIIINGVDIGYAINDYFTKNGGPCNKNSSFDEGTCHGHEICVEATDSRCNCMRYWPTRSNCQVDLYASQCLGFARYCEWRVYGHFETGEETSYFEQWCDEHTGVTGEEMKNLFLNCAPATHVRLRGFKNEAGGSHSISIVATDNEGVFFVDCNSDGACGVDGREPTWDLFANYINSKGGILYAFSSRTWEGTPAPQPVNTPPDACLDTIEGGVGTVSVSGWAYDPDNISLPLAVHVYLIDSAGGEHKVGEFLANKTHIGADDVWHCGKEHGFSGTLDTGGLSGVFTVRIAALDIETGGNGATWREIDNGTKTVSIPARTAMTSGYDRVVPDGDYMIVAAGAEDKSSQYYLDIEGSESVATLGKNVQLCGPTVDYSPGDCDTWTLSYKNGFYTITQKSSNGQRALDLDGAGVQNCANVHIWESNSSSAQQWAISQNPDAGGGYRIQARCSGLSLDIDGGKIAYGTNIRQHFNNDSMAQSWLLIPYKPAQPLKNGKYILLSQVNSAYELDVPGNTGDVGDQTKIQLWEDKAPSQYNSFEITKLDNGYYKIIHDASGKAMEVYGGGCGLETRISLYTPNGSYAQQWAITGNY